VKAVRLAEVERELEDPKIWDDQKRAQALGKEKKGLEDVVHVLTDVDSRLTDSAELFALAREDNDDATLNALERDVAGIEKTVADMEFRRMFSNPMDPASCFIDIQAGSGGTEAQDWAAMLERMYLRYCERKGYRTEVLEESPGEVAGIKSASIKVEGDYAYGYLRTEVGVHRLVRKSPFDSNARRHTSFASVFVYPEVDDSIEVEINPADLASTPFRASGAGGPAHQQDGLRGADHAPADEHRRPVPERPLAAPQPGGSDGDAQVQALRARDPQAARRSSRSSRIRRPDIGWGHQIRSYVLDQSRIKDLRTNYEVGNTQAVLDGDLDDFIAASLKQGV
jgi:peptide chain release factor 2